MLANRGLQGKVFGNAAHCGTVRKFDSAWPQQLFCLDVVFLFDSLIVSEAHCCTTCVDQSYCFHVWIKRAHGGEVDFE
jgi:hypothetical protein